MSTDRIETGRAAASLAGKRIAVVGVGKIGEALISGLLRAGQVRAEDISGTCKHDHEAQAAAGRLGIRVVAAPDGSVEGRDIVVLAVKPPDVAAAVDGVAAHLAPGALLITVAASVSTRAIEARLPTMHPVVRAMPNTPILLGAGVTALCAGSHAGEGDLRLARAVFDAVGRTVIVDDERLMDAVTGLSGSGPAYLYMVIESLAEGGVKMGLPRRTSTLLAAQTMLGAARMCLELEEHPALLKDGVTTPAGCTIDGILKLEEGGLRVTLIKAVVEATRRARELVDG